jgi:TRAP-type C4-dicarboxylate transport system permease small subunit
VPLRAAAFWVEEVGEAALAWITLIGAAVGVMDRTHFTLNVLVHKFPPGAQRAIHVANHVLIVGFALLVAWVGWKLAALNASLTSPGLEFSLAWLYIPAVVGGLLMAVYALAAARSHAEHGVADVRE